jgi:hypothetical protein
MTTDISPNLTASVMKKKPKQPAIIIAASIATISQSGNLGSPVTSSMKAPLKMKRKQE